MTCQIFISYRRADSKGSVNFLYEKLKKKFSSNRIFMDTGSIAPGSTWPNEIRTSLEEAEIVLVIIGKNWLTAGMNEYGVRRIDNPDDWVRQEIETAIKTGKTIIPILIDIEWMPPPEAFPETIKPLTDLQAFPIKSSSEKSNGIPHLMDFLSEELNVQQNKDELRRQLEKIIAEKYKIKKLIAKGSRASVYLADDTALNRDVAIKVIEDPSHKPEFVETIRDAAKVAGSIPNCIHICGAWINKDPAHVVMELMAGTLRKFINESEGKGLYLPVVHKYLFEIGNALVKAHNAGLTHCNIKPSNIFLSGTKEPYISPLCRIQKITSKSYLKRFSENEGSLNESSYREDLCYLAPEIFDKSYYRISPEEEREKIDQYMLGLLGYEMLKGSTPVTIDNLQELKNKGSNAFRPLEPINSFRKNCPNRFWEIIKKMTDLNPKYRYDDLGQAVNEISKVSFTPIEIAKESYMRCIMDKKNGKDFFRSFYSEFIRIAPKYSEKFKVKGIGHEKEHKQYELLKEAVFILLHFAEFKLGNKEPNILTRIAKVHNEKNYDIPPPAYNKFVEALINTVCGNDPHIPEPFDEQCKTHPNEKELIKDAWEKALEPGVRFMKEKYWASGE